MTKYRPSEDRTDGKERLQRVMADAGIAARRVCERMIEEGLVTVNGRLVTKLPVFVDPREDEIFVEGRRLPKPDRNLYIMLNKPDQTLTVAADEPGLARRTVLDMVNHPAAARLYPVGRLDYGTTGMVLLTNDGDLTHKLTHAKYGVVKTYQALVRGIVDDERLAAIAKKLRSERRREARESAAAAARQQVYGERGPEIRIMKKDSGRTLLEITMMEARNRELREVFQIVGCPIKKLTRVAIGPLVMTGLAPGSWRELSGEEVRMLRDAVSTRPGARKAPAQSPKNRSIRRGDRKPGTRPAKPRVEAAPEAAAQPAQPKPKAEARPVAPVRKAPPVAAKPKGPRVIKP